MMSRFKQNIGRSRQTGFTLMEVMIVVVIVGLLASLALPSYSSYVTRSQRQAGKNVLYRIADRQEQYFIDNKQYAANLSTLGYAEDTLTIGRDGDIDASTASKPIYGLTLTNATATTYTVQVAPKGSQASKDADCGTLTLSHLGVRAVSGASTDCW
jgi:type IV pilus assembly protein PilE